MVAARMEVICAFIPGPVKRFVAWLSVGLAVIWATWAAGKRDARQKAALDAAQGAIKSHEARNEVESDVDRIPDPKQRLRDKWRR